jgi:beta-glucosidase
LKPSKPKPLKSTHVCNSNHITAHPYLPSVFPVPDVCLVFLKAYSREGVDRASLLADWNSTAVVTTVASRCPNTAVITHSAGPHLLPFASNPNVTAMPAAHLPGQEAGNSITDVLFGAVNPSGRLPYTIAASAEDYNAPIFNFSGPPALDSSLWQLDFTEGPLIDYRHFDAQDISPLYEFGYGLSYTTFSLTGKLSISKFQRSRLPPPPAGPESLYTPLLKVKASVKNTGPVSGATVPQLYLSYPESVPPPSPRVLRGFEKVFLAPHESREIVFLLNRRDLSYWDSAKQSWTLPTGKYQVNVGFSSRDFRLNGDFTIH